MSKTSDISDYLGAAVGLCFVMFIIYAVGSSIFSSTTEASKVEGTCKDVTSHDYNWDNDMLCTREDGTEFYTDYAGARSFEPADSEPVSDHSSSNENATIEVSDNPVADLSSGEGGSCEDVTSYDYDWKNDMLCTRSDGSTFYTDYAGAEAFSN